MLKGIIKKQFNRQAKSFSSWSVTKNIEYMQAHFDFFRMNENDTMLDVACGTGEFSIFVAKKVKYVLGIDISDEEIKLANEQAESNNVTNVKFICHNVEKIPCDDNSYSIAVCKSAFHHMQNYSQVFLEMLRCCKNLGRVGIQDIVAYDDKKTNDFFEGMEKAIDISHNSALSLESIVDLFKANDLKIVNEFQIEIELNFQEYLRHAYQSESSIRKIEKLLKFGLEDKGISKYFIIKDDELFFKRNVLLILGEKM